jgi:hypothetical protein
LPTWATIVAASGRLAGLRFGDGRTEIGFGGGAIDALPGRSFYLLWPICYNAAGHLSRLWAGSKA